MKRIWGLGTGDWGLVLSLSKYWGQGRQGRQGRFYFLTHHSPLITQHSPLTTHYSALSTHHSQDSILNYYVYYSHSTSRSSFSPASKFKYG
ncbi:hypothetical protein ACQFX9_16680 [Aliinostoc sp. HNIBRCY26]|uniref:hypothetical protein n=1 Tax=Aliinostoc sp. HNIBRCY26 TaxID=3418997 RepID=UPI003D020959